MRTELFHIYMKYIIIINELLIVVQIQLTLFFLNDTLGDSFGDFFYNVKTVCRIVLANLLTGVCLSMSTVHGTCMLS